MQTSLINLKGLNEEEVSRSRQVFGSNTLYFKKENAFWQALQQLLSEPMVLLLLATSSIYFVVGEFGDGIFLAIAILLVSAISLFQDSRSKKALEKLKTSSQPLCKVVRNNVTSLIPLEDVVVGDLLIVEEGSIIAADGTIIQSNDFSVDESVLTGESLAVFKNTSMSNPTVYRGTSVVSGLAVVEVKTVGNKTQLGKIGESIATIKEEKSPLEIQINSFVKRMTALGIIIFLLVWGINFFKTRSVVDSLLRALTLAMSILPQEIPVAFTTFLALGARRLMKIGIVVKQIKTVETLGSATVICVDKTGTITKNQMSLASLFVLKTGKIRDLKASLGAPEKKLIQYAMWASEPIPFDPMEIALHKAYTEVSSEDQRNRFTMRHEYPLGGQPPMMTHIFEDTGGNRIIAAKGALETFLKIANLSGDEVRKLQEAATTMAAKGYRLLAVARSTFAGESFPRTQQEFHFELLGLVAFYDPPKPNIEGVLQDFYKAGIDVKIITGDNEITTRAIADQINFRGKDKMIDGTAIMKLKDSPFQRKVQETSVFTRMFPDAKLRLVEALKANGQIVSMTGDGSNDGPALKAANIGVAMGKKGTEIAKASADLVLLEDDLSTMVAAIAMGRRIYGNLKKAIQYVISIHIPIILVVFIPLALGWVYPNIFTPVHIILLEMIMGPTCSIIYENEPMEVFTMDQKPRPFRVTFFKWNELFTSILQGLMITLGALLVYEYAITQGLNESLTRTMVFTVLISANIFLTLVNRSFIFSVITTLSYKNHLVPVIILITTMLTALLIYVKSFADFFAFQPLSSEQLGISIAIGFLFVIWYEGVKWGKRISMRPLSPSAGTGM